MGKSFAQAALPMTGFFAPVMAPGGLNAAFTATAAPRRRTPRTAFARAVTPPARLMAPPKAPPPKPSWAYLS